ncbi:MAG: hypothetical protein NTV05_18290 [Acidobacteria bacterium]|nr:hypothetical protein [Acidobacteriota bacterium]
MAKQVDAFWIDGGLQLDRFDDVVQESWPVGVWSPELSVLGFRSGQDDALPGGQSLPLVEQRPAVAPVV